MRREIANDVPTGTIARFKGEWGVVGRWISGAREFDRWYGPRILLRGYEVVDIPSDRRR